MDRFFPAPEDPADWPAWREALHAWRRGYRALSGWSPPAYPAWARRAYAQALVMLWDQELWTPEQGWRIDALLDRAERDYGGWDCVVLWNNYPLSGLDRRDQYDYFRDLPGGLEGLRDCVRACHRRGVRVMIDHKPWVPGVPAGFASVEHALVDLVERCELDGIYLDCADQPQPRLRQLLTALGDERVFSSEATTPLEALAAQPSSWSQFTADSAAPGVFRNRWLERGCLVYETRRYHHHPMAELQRAWLNGGGSVIWENVFGYWAAYSERYRDWLRLLLPAQRRLHPLFAGEDWEPLLGGRPQQGIHASRWQHGALRLWTLCNRSGQDHAGELIDCEARADEVFVDPISGQELTVATTGGRVTVSGRIGVEGIAGVLGLPAASLDADWRVFLAAQRERHDHAGFGFTPWTGEHRLTELPHALRPVAATARTAALPEDMLPVSGRSWTLRSRYRMRECGYIAGSPSERHVYDAFERECVDERPVEVGDFAIDRLPVTNAAFATFLAASGYRPQHGARFLAHWVDGRPPRGQEDHPVVYVDLDDARAYARWAGKRLPREEEWQLAALGERPGPFPWGAELGRDCCNDGSHGGTTPVAAYPRGAAACGALDMIGNVWELTESERSDGHTRYVILKGGCWYGAAGSHWLFDGGPRGADWGAKQILLWPGWDRCATIGFRCVIDR